MAKFRADEVDNYGGQGGGGFFSLKNHHDTARVRFMYNGIDDVEGISVHEIPDPSGDPKKKQVVECLREYNDKLEVCPFCAAGRPTKAVLYIPLYDVDSGQTKLWQRGKKFFGKIASICNRYSGKDNPLVSHTFEIERNGEAGDQATTYEIYEIDQDDTTLEDLPAAPNTNCVLNKTAEDMEYYLQEGEFPPTDDNDDYEEEQPRRRSSRSSDTGRRTPARNRREAF